MENSNGAAAPDSVKLFVGQVPRQMTEEQLLPIFQEAGVVRELSVIKDKATKVSRGCCFLIYETKEEADKAIALFHNNRKLPPLSTPLQVKYADGELERLEHKLFVGMLPKIVSEADLTAIFAPFGVIKELTVIKGSQASRGCAFLKYETKDQALAAIKALNEVYKMEGSATPLVVKWADTEKEKQARKQQRAQVLPTAPAPQPSPYGLVPGAYSVAPPLSGYGYQATQNPYSMPQYSTTSGLQGQSAVLGGMMGAVNVPVSMPTSGYDMTTGTAGSALPPAYGTTQPSTYTYPSGYSAVPNLQYPAMHQPNLVTQGNVASMYQSPGLANMGMAPSVGMAPMAKSVSPQVEGPPGANLFIYHLPADFGDHELTTTFQPFGNVISAKVYIDKNTGLSKCFGFVSFDNPEAAASAISTMNGAPLGGKRLKVQLKRDNRQNKPY